MALNILILTTEVLNSKLTLSAGDSVMWQTSSYTASVAFTSGKSPFTESFPASLSLAAPDKYSSSYTISGKASGTYSYEVTVNSSPANKISCSIKVIADQDGEDGEGDLPSS